MMRAGLFDHGRHSDPLLESYLAQILGTGLRLSVSDKSATILEIWDRFCHDQIDPNQYRTGCGHAGANSVCDSIHDYTTELSNRLLYDFSRLEQEFLVQLQTGTVNGVLNSIKFVLVDEYQDTNLLQEMIYFALARVAINNMGSIAVVGDDDQSLYRFRGATVDLFQAFSSRINNQLGINPTTVHLSRNYRSTAKIVSFFQDFITLDASFQVARVVNKPRVTSMRNHPYVDYPILGMFRPNVQILANSLADFIHRVTRRAGVNVPDSQGVLYTIRLNTQGGSSGDIALLCSSPRELNSQGNPRLPLLLRTALGNVSPPIRVFNPRGEHLELIPDVQNLCGLVLECLDPNSNVQNMIRNLPNTAVDVFNTWRLTATTFINTNPRPVRPRTLAQFVTSWQLRTPLGIGRSTWNQREVPLLDLVYKLVTWIPNMQNDIEGLVYLEAIMRTISQSGLFSNFGAEIVVDSTDPRLEQASIREVMWNIFLPIATGAIQINEDLLETLPSDRINVMSIHQVKGLEFPLVIVDVGSDFRQEYHAQRFKRFPIVNTNGQVDRTNSVNMEDALRPYSPLGSSPRSALDRAFDDLIRHYYVSYSRPQDVLLLVGLNSVGNGYYLSSGLPREIPNIATGWDRNAHWRWGQGLPNLIHI
jgi:DNA helicase-2/ATP-dependent DNA helicase PcrA